MKKSVVPAPVRTLTQQSRAPEGAVRKFVRAAALLTLFVCALPLAAQVATGANVRYQTADGRQAVAATLGAPDRDERQKPRDLVQGMGLQKGMTVADVGTGIGYMLPFLSRSVGSSGQVFAEDIFDDFLSAARQVAVNQNLMNITFLKGTDKDPMLPENTLDRVLVLDAYHHFDYPEAMLAAIRKSLKPDGKLVIVEYYKRPGAMANNQAVTHIRLDMPDLIKEVEANHFKLVSEREQIKDSQYMLILEKK